MMVIIIMVSGYHFPAKVDKGTAENSETVSYVATICWFSDKNLREILRLVSMQIHSNKSTKFIQTLPWLGGLYVEEIIVLWSRT
jgi:hypothetical protein